MANLHPKRETMPIKEVSYDKIKDQVIAKQKKGQGTRNVGSFNLSGKPRHFATSSMCRRTF